MRNQRSLVVAAGIAALLMPAAAQAATKQVTIGPAKPLAGYAYYCAVHGNDMAGEIVVQ